VVFQILSGFQKSKLKNLEMKAVAGLCAGDGGDWKENEESR
jgi:hypothetical protein